jgi:hypothetical protein
MGQQQNEPKRDQGQGQRPPDQRNPQERQQRDESREERKPQR